MVDLPVAQGPSPEPHTARYPAKRQFHRYPEQYRPYFVTANTHERRPIFLSPAACRVVLDNLVFYRDRGDFWLHAYVVMPDHLHLLLTPVKGDLSGILRNVKSYIARQLIDTLGEPPPVWQPRFHDRGIRSESQYSAAVDYIHSNPVKAGFCEAASEFLFSSARAYWGGGEPLLGVQALGGSRLGP